MTLMSKPLMSGTLRAEGIRFYVAPMHLWAGVAVLDATHCLGQQHSHMLVGEGLGEEKVVLLWSD